MHLDQVARLGHHVFGLKKQLGKKVGLNAINNAVKGNVLEATLTRPRRAVAVKVTKLEATIGVDVEV